MNKKSDLKPSLGYSPIARVIDASGLRCPMPLLKAKQGLNQCAEGDMIEVMATDPQSVRDFQAFVELTNHELVACESSKDAAADDMRAPLAKEYSDKYYFVIRKG